MIPEEHLLIRAPAFKLVDLNRQLPQRGPRSVDVEISLDAAQKEVLDTYKKEFDVLSTGFQQLDTKAQGAATVAGAFLAAGLALLNRPALLKSAWPEVLFVLAIIGLMLAILMAIQALRIRKIIGCPSGEDLARPLSAIRERPEAELPERLHNFFNDVTHLWSSCVADRRAANRKKARYVWLSQVCLTISSLCIGTIVISIIVGG